MVSDTIHDRTVRSVFRPVDSKLGSAAIWMKIGVGSTSNGHIYLAQKN